MPIPAILIAAKVAVATIATVFVKEIVLKPKPTAQADKLPFPKNPEPEETEEDRDTTPQVDNRPTTIYNIDSSRTYVINVGSSGGSVEIPALRLPQEVDNQTATKTPRGKSIDIKKSVFEHEFGGLLAQAITDKTLPIYEYEATQDSQDEFLEYQENNTNLIAEYLLNRSLEGQVLTTPARLEQLGILLVPENLRGFSGEIGLLLGHEPLSILNREYTGRSLTAYMQPRLSAYKYYKKVPKKLDSKTILKQPEDEEGDIKLSVTSIGGIWEWLGIDNLSRHQNGEMIIDELLEKFGNANLLQVDGKDEDGKPTYKPQAWRMDSLLDYFTSLISVVFWKLGLNEIPVKVPKNLAELPKLDEIQGERDLDKTYFNSDDKANLYQDEENPDFEKIEESLSEELKEKYYQEVYSLSELATWQTKQLDNVLGSFPIEIDIKDNDLIEVGEQGLKISLPNLAETLAELVGNSIEQQAVVDALMNITLRNLQETGSSKMQAVKNNYQLEAIADYLGFKLAKKKKKVQFTYNPLYGSDKKESEKEEKESLTEALEPTEVEIDIIDFDDETSLEEHMMTLVEAARITKAANWRTVDPNNIKALKDLFLDAGKLLNNEEEPPPGKKEDKQDFDLFLEDVEKGFTTTPGITDDKNPYGKNYERRPRIREIGENASTDNGD